MTFHLLNLVTPVGKRAARRLREDHVAWLTTVDRQGVPQPTPVWFLWDEAQATVLLYSLPDAKRLVHLKLNPWVALHFDGDGMGTNILVMTGKAHENREDLPADKVAAYVEKYREFFPRIKTTAVQFAATYSVPVRISLVTVRGSKN
jgi:PPOX class probable F420-dependent enzyme